MLSCIADIASDTEVFGAAVVCVLPHTTSKAWRVKPVTLFASQ